MPQKATPAIEETKAQEKVNEEEMNPLDVLSEAL
jgi:hypothetical protein